MPIALATTSAATIAATLMDEVRRRRLIVPGQPGLIFCPGMINRSRRKQAMSVGKGPGEGGNPVKRTGHDPANYKTPVAQREIGHKEQGNPKERQAEQERISRDDALHWGGFPVVGHGEPEPENDPGRERSR
jgi:hypothetical protein